MVARGMLDMPLRSVGSFTVHYLLKEMKTFSLRCWDTLTWLPGTRFGIMFPVIAVGMTAICFGYQQSEEIRKYQQVKVKLTSGEVDQVQTTWSLNCRSDVPAKRREANSQHSAIRCVRDEKLLTGPLRTGLIELLLPCLFPRELTFLGHAQTFWLGFQAPLCGKKWVALDSSASGDKPEDSPTPPMTGPSPVDGSSNAEKSPTDDSRPGSNPTSACTSTALQRPLQYLSPNVSENARSHLTNLMVAPLGTTIRGWLCDQDRPSDETDEVDGARPASAIKVSFAKVAKIFYEVHADNFFNAVQRRLTDKLVPYTCHDKDVRRIGDAIDAMKECVFNKSAVKRALEEIGLFPNMKSKKWSSERFEKTIDDLLTLSDPSFRVSGSVKLEPSNPEKPPRFLIADGDDGQVMALVSIFVTEHILFHRFKNNSIKHCSKQVAMQRIFKDLNLDVKEQTIIETDGSAWDTTCGIEIRDATENRIIEHVSKIIHECGWFQPQVWSDAHSTLNKQKKLKLKVCKKMPGQDLIKAIIKAIRRSGHRGTSGLNWLINMILTDLSLFEAPYHNAKGKPGGLLIPSCRTAIDFKKRVRRVYRSFEGDDGITALQGNIDDEYKLQILAFWTRCGFRMKLKLPTTVAEFVGWKIPLKDRVPVHYPIPDILRMMAQSAYSTAPEAVAMGTSITSGCKTVAAKFKSYAALAIGLPTFAEFFTRCSDFYGGCSAEDATPDIMRAHQHDCAFIGACPVAEHDYVHDDIVDIFFDNLTPPGQATASQLAEEEDVLRWVGVVEDHAQYVALCDGLGTMLPDCTDVDAEALCLRDYRE